MQRPHRAIRAAAVVSLALLGLTCRERSTTGPGLPSIVSLSLAPQLAVQGGVPTVRMARARVTARRLPSRTVAVDTVATFPATGDELAISLRIPMLAPLETFELLVRGIAASGDTVYASADTVELRQGADPSEPVSVDLGYVGPDTIVATLAVAPRDTTFRSSDTVQMRAVARRLTGDPVPAALIEWTSRDVSKFTIDPATGRLAAKGTFSGVWIVAATANGRFDSTQVSSIPPVATVTIDVATPGEQTVTRGDTRRFTVTLRGPAGEAITGRPVVWSVDRPLGGTVDGTGLFSALRADSVVTVSATSEGKVGSVVVRVGRKGVGRVDLSAVLDTILPGATKSYTAAAFDSAGVTNLDHPIVWTSLDAAIATVAATADGRSATVTGVSIGSTTIRATSGVGAAGAQRDLALTVHFPLDSIVAAPRLDTLVAFGATAAHTVTAFRGATPIASGVTFAWSTRDALVATVDATGTVTAVANGATWIDVGETTSGLARRDSVRVVVQQRVATIRLVPDSVVRYVGTIQRIGADAMDARGNVMTGRSFTWTTLSGGEIARVDSTRAGEAFFTAVAVGTDTVIVTDSEAAVQARTSFRVRPLLTSIVLRPADTTLTALGDRITVTAVGRDSLDAPMTGIVFAFTTSAPTLVRLDSARATEVQAVALANGVATLTATAQGVSGTTSVTVAQTATHISVTPPSASVSLGGLVALTAQVRDRNDNAMGGFSFTWESDVPEIASVGVDNGLVTALGPGIAHITARTGALVSAPVPITVSGLALSFGTDTVFMAPRTRVNVPIQLSVPLQVPIAVEVVAVPGGPIGIPGSDEDVLVAGRASGVRRADCTTIECFTYDPDSGTVGVTQRIVIFEPGETVQHIELRANAVGGVRLIVRPYDPAIDPCTISPEFCESARRAAAFWPQLPALYAPDTLVAGVIGTNFLHLDRAVSVTRGDSAAARVVMTTPRPDTVRVTFDVLGAGARIKRAGIDSSLAAADTAYILPGQLSADVTVYATGAGSGDAPPDVVVSVRPRDPTSSMLTAPSTVRVVMNQRLTIYSESRAHPGILVVGAGQVDSTAAQVVPSRLSVPLTVTFTPDDPAIATTTPAALSVDGSGARAFFGVRGVAPGTTRLRATAPGWVGDEVNVRVTTPRLQGGTSCCDGTTLTTLSAPQDVLVLVTDSLGVPHARATDLAVSVTSSNPAVVEVEGGTAIVPAGQQAGGGARLIARSPGTAVIRFSAPGHPDHEVTYTVAALALAASSSRDFSDGIDSSVTAVGMFQHDSALFVRTPAPVQTTTAVALVHDGSIVSTPDSVFIPAGASQVRLGRIVGVATGRATITLRAAGFQDATATVTVTRPRAVLAVEGLLDVVTAKTFFFTLTDSAQQVQLYPATSTVVNLVSRNESVVKSTSTSVSYVPESPQNIFQALVTPAGIGSTHVVATATGFIPDSVPVTVVGPRVIGMVDEVTVGVGLRATNVPFVRALADTLPVTFTLSRDNEVSTGGAEITPNPVTVAANQVSTLIAVSGTARGFVRFGLQEQGTTRYAPGVHNDVLVTRGFLRLTAAPSAAAVEASGTKMLVGTATSMWGLAMDSTSNALGVRLTDISTNRPALIRIRSTNDLVLRVRTAADEGFPTTSVDLSIDSGATAITEQVYVYAVGPGTAQIVVEDVSNLLDMTTPELWQSSSSGIITVDQPRIAFTSGAATSRIPFMSLGMRQRLGGTTPLQVCRVPSADGIFTRTDRSVVVNLSSTDARVAVAYDPSGEGGESDAQVAIPAGSLCADVELVGHDTTGTVAVAFTAFDSGEGSYAADTLRVEVGRPGVVFELRDSTAISTLDSSRQVFAYPIDHRGNRRASAAFTRLQIVSSDSSVLVGSDTVVNFFSGTTSYQFRVHPRGLGAARLRVRDARAVPGDPSGADPVERRVAYGGAEVALSTEAPRLALSLTAPSALGRGQRRQVVLSASSVGLAVRTFTITSTDPSVLVPLKDTVQINGAEGATEGILDVDGVADGVADVIVSAPGFAPVRATFRVSRGSISLANVPTELHGGVGSTQLVIMRLTDSTGVPADGTDPRAAAEEKFYVTYQSSGTGASGIVQLYRFNPDYAPESTAPIAVPLETDAGGTFVRMPANSSGIPVFLRVNGAGSERITLRNPRYRDVITPRITVTLPPG